MPPSISLIVANGRRKGERLRIRRFPFAIGRGVGCDLRCASLQIADRHCVIFVDGDRVFVRDFVGGTSINGRAVLSAIAVANGDILKIGPLEFLITLGGQVADSTKAMPSRDDLAAEMLLEASGDPDALGDTIIPGEPTVAAEAALREASRPIAAANAQDAASAILANFSKRKR